MFKKIFLPLVIALISIFLCLDNIFFAQQLKNDEIIAVINCKGFLYLLYLEGRKEKILSAPSISNWALSPDKSKLAYEKNGDIYVLDLMKKITTRITTHPSSDCCPFWSPDSKKLGFLSERRKRKVYGDFTEDIYITDNLNLPESNIKMIFKNELSTPLKEQLLILSSPVWSPDGKKIAFLVIYSEERGGTQPVDIFVHFLDTNKTKKVLRNIQSDCSKLTWSSDSKEIAHESWIVNIETNSVKEIKIKEVGSLLNATWSPDGKYIAYNSLTYREYRTPTGYLTFQIIGDIYIVNSEKEEIIQLTSNKNTRGKIIDFSPLWINSKKIIFERWTPVYEYYQSDSYIKDKNSQIYIMDLETKKTIPLTEEGCVLTNYMWSQS